MPLDDEKFLRRSFDVARRALAHGNHPFGAVLVSAASEVLIEVENGYLPDKDMTATPSGFSQHGHQSKYRNRCF
jgi:tRNA(Arg) A34 adenosine deaminase TadA